MKLHIGGEVIKDGWQILNVLNKPGVDYVGDISDLSQFPDETCSEIYASHVLEHVPQQKVLDTLIGVKRILIPGGKFYISVPDMDILCHTFINPLASSDIKFHVMRMIFGGQVDEYDFHCFGWNINFLFEYLQKSNFSNAERVNSFGIFEDTSNYAPYGFPISLNVVATK